MKQPEHEIKNLIKSALHKASPNMSFEALWAMHSNRDKVKAKYRKAALIPLIALFTLLLCFSIGYAYSRMVDNTDLPFVDDYAVIGKWETVDFVNDIKDFAPGKHSFNAELFHLNNLEFSENGKMLIKIENSSISYSGWTWTKNVIIDKVDKTASRYEIIEINGSNYMFMEWKSGDYTIRFMKPKYYVLKKVE